MRDYGTARWEGGDAQCDHRPKRQPRSERPNVFRVGLATIDAAEPVYRDTCGKCGATRIDSQLGLEATIDEYVAKMVEVFREVRRVLRKDGTLWLNLGDSYVRQGGTGEGRARHWDGRAKDPSKADVTHVRNTAGLKPKDLVGIPWRVAFALQADGWYLRSDIIWAKPNPMPESVTDRPTKAHEYVFLLSKSAKYHYDADAIAEPAGPFRPGGRDNGLDHPKTSDPRKKQDALGKQTYTGFNDRWKAKQRKPAGWDTGNGAHGAFHRDGRAQEVEYTETESPTRNKRTVWTIPTQPFKEAHFATYPEKLVEPCILAGCPVGGVVLDPFAGSGTTLVVARKLGREGVGIELNPEYAAMAEKRLRGVTPALEGLCRDRA